MSIYMLSSGLRMDYEGYFPEMDLSLQEGAPSLSCSFEISKRQFKDFFFSRYGIEYIVDEAIRRSIPFRVVTHPVETTSCAEKIALLPGWPLARAIKTVYLEIKGIKGVYGVCVPEMGRRLALDLIGERLCVGAQQKIGLTRHFPRHMKPGTCSPFLDYGSALDDRVGGIIFDSDMLATKKVREEYDDFSFGDDRRLSVQMNYWHCFELLRAIFPDLIVSMPVLQCLPSTEMTL